MLWSWTKWGSCVCVCVCVSVCVCLCVCVPVCFSDRQSICGLCKCSLLISFHSPVQRVHGVRGKECMVSINMQRVNCTEHLGDFNKWRELIALNRHHTNDEWHENRPETPIVTLTQHVSKLYKVHKLFFFYYNCTVPMGFLPWEIWVAFPRESQLRQSCATQPKVHAGCLFP